jgi:hypothetical protein
MNGRKVSSDEVEIAGNNGSGSMNLDISKLAAGTYTVVLTADGRQIKAEKLVIIQ